MMDGILGIAKDIGAEVNVHTEKLKGIDTEMQGAEENVKLGNE